MNEAAVALPPPESLPPSPEEPPSTPPPPAAPAVPRQMGATSLHTAISLGDADAIQKIADAGNRHGSPVEDDLPDPTEGHGIASS